MQSGLSMVSSLLAGDETKCAVDKSMHALSYYKATCMVKYFG